MDEITHTIMPGNNGGWGGTALGAGVGGLIGSWLGNGGFGGLGAGRGAGIGYDTGAINGMANQLGNIQTQIANADRDLLMQTANSNQFVGNLVNNTGDAIVTAVNDAARDNQAGIFQNTLTQTQSGLRRYRHRPRWGESHYFPASRGEPSSGSAAGRTAAGVLLRGQTGYRAGRLCQPGAPAGNPIPGHTGRSRGIAG